MVSRISTKTTFYLAFYRLDPVAYLFVITREDVRQLGAALVREISHGVDLYRAYRGAVTFASVVLAMSRSRTVMEVKVDHLTERYGMSNSLICEEGPRALGKPSKLAGLFVV